MSASYTLFGDSVYDIDEISEPRGEVLRSVFSLEPAKRIDIDLF